METNIEKIQIPHTLPEMVKSGEAKFSHYKEGNLFYTFEAGVVEKYKYEFPIAIVETDYMSPENEGEDEIQIIKLSTDVGETRFENSYKTITLMRYIRKAIADGKLRWDKII